MKNNKNNNNYDLYKIEENRNEINTTDMHFKIYPTPYKIPMTSAPTLFDDFNNSSNFDGRTPLYPKGKFSKTNQLKNFFFNALGFIYAKNVFGGGPLSTSKKNTKIFAESLKKTKEKNNTEDKIETESFCSYPQSSLLGNISAINCPFSEKPDYQSSDLALSNNKIGLNMINRLMELPCQINVPFFKYVIENLPRLVEIGILPPLEIKNSNNIKANKKKFLVLITKWYDFHNRFLTLDEKKKKKQTLFTGKEIILNDNNFPHALDKKLEKVLFKNKKSALLSLQGISQSFNRSLKMGWFFINTPLFFSMKFDTRGRLYYKNEFSPLQRPFGRNLLRFIKPSLIKTGSKEEFIFFSELGMSIKEHSCYKDAFAFVCENKEEIIKTLKNFSWTTFLEPWASLNYILEFASYFSHSQQSRDLGVELYIQIELDASSSVLQVNSVLSKNTFIAQSVNLLPAPADSDADLISNKNSILKKQSVTDCDYIKSLENLKVSDIYSLLLNWYQDYMLDEGRKNNFLCLLEDEMQNNHSSLSEEGDDEEDDIPKRSNKTKSTINLSPLLDQFICFLDRPLIKSHLMTKLYNKGNEKLAQDIYEKISLMEVKKGSSLMIKEDDYQSIWIETQTIFDISYNRVDSLIQKKDKKSFLTSDLQLHSKINSVKGLLPISIYDGKESQQNQERLIEDFLPLESLNRVRELEKDVRELEKKKKISNTSLKDLNNLKLEIKKKNEEWALLILTNCMNIESNSIWVHYFFKRFFSEFSKQNNKSLEDFEEKLMSLQKLFEKEKDYSNFLSLDSKGILSKVETNSTKISFNTSSLEKVLQRKQIFIEIQEVLIKNYQTLQKREFKQIVSKLITKVLQEICQKHLRDVFINSEIISLLASFVSTRKCSFTVNCFEHAFYRTYYSSFLSNNYYFADDPTKKQKEKIQKKRVKIGYYGETPDPDKSFTASPANFIQACDGEILRNVVSPFLDQFPGKGLWVRHDAFVVDCSTYFDIQNLYKESFLKVFFKKDAVSKGLKTNKVFLRVFNNKEKENLIKEAGLENAKSPLFIFQILIISNFFNLLDLSEKSYIKEFKVKNKKILKIHNRKVKILLLEFLYEPSLKSIDIVLKSVQGTFLDSDLNEKQREILPEKKEIDFDSLKNKFKKKLEDDLQKVISRGNKLINKWEKESQKIREGVKDLKPVDQSEPKKPTGDLKNKQQKIKLLENKIKKKKVVIEDFEKKKKEIPERAFTKDELLEFKKDLDLKDSNDQEKIANKKYGKLKDRTAIKKTNFNLKPTLFNILIRYFIIHEKIKSNKFSCDDLLSLTRALS